MGRVLGAMAVAVLAGGACGGAREPDLTVLAAASLTDAFEEIAAEFEADRDVDVTLSFGASSSLREQILEGAPADVFASAGSGPVEALVQAGEVGEPATFARNRLAIAVPAGNPAGVRSLEDLADGSLLLGVCAPEVPCGALARTVLEAAGVAAEPDTEEPDVRALLTKVEEAELDAGLVYVTDVLAAGDAVEAVDLPGDASTAYPIAVVDGAGATDLASDFVDFVLGEDGQRILREAGFGAP
ncbi:MAG: molybdate ABC transporter substrate-binding protein [Acidimicrobiia bacterium]